MVVGMSPAEESAYWNQVAADPGRLVAEVYSDMRTSECIKAILDGVGGLLVPGASILELGCGIGRLLSPLAAIYPTVNFVGVDSSEAMIREVMTSVAANVQLAKNDGRTLSGLAEFDAAYSMTMFQHIPREAQFGYLAEVYRTLVPGGPFRLQFVTDAEPGPLSHPVPLDAMIAEAEAVGFDLMDGDQGLIEPSWYWLTLRKS